MPRLAGTILLGLIVFVACSDAQPAQPIPADLAAALERTSAYQREILEDGHVSLAEYERAVLATVECMQAEGVVISVQPYETWRGQLDFAWTSTDESSPRNWTIYESCWIEHADIVAVQYFNQIQPSEQEREEARSELKRCLAEAGSNPPGDPTSDYYRSLAATGDEAFRICRAKVVEEFDFSEGWIP